MYTKKYVPKFECKRTQIDDSDGWMDDHTSHQPVELDSLFEQS